MINRVVSGAAAGLFATIPMTLVILLGRQLRMLWIPPPVEITGKAVNRSGLDQDQSSDAFTAGWVAAHFGYGAACGAIYGIARPIMPADSRIAGLLFGETVWAVSYLGFVPALGLYPWPKDDSKSRMAVMIAAHAVYGIATAKLDQNLSSKISDPAS